MRPTRRLLLFLVLLSSQTLWLRAQDITLPLKSGSVRFAAIGDMGNGEPAQYEIAQRMLEFRQKFSFNFVIMLGDNIYGGKSPAELQKKFELPYKPLLDAGVQFYASLGNHDDTNERFYKFFNMNGERYHSFKKGNVHFFAIDSTYLDPKQLAWLEKELASSGSDWKFAYFHHPLYSSGGRHGSDTALRDQLEPLFLKYGVDVVLAGHEHFYERLKPQKGIHYFISGGAGKLRKGDVGGEFTEKAFDTGFHFMIFELLDDRLHFQVITDQGKTVDSGIIERRKVDTKAAPSVPAAPPAKPVPPTTRCSDK